MGTNNKNKINNNNLEEFICCDLGYGKDFSVTNIFSNGKLIFSEYISPG